MAASVQYRQQEGSLRGGMKDDDLSLFLEMQNSDMGKNNLSHVPISDEFDDLLELKPESSLMSETTATMHGPETMGDDFLNSESCTNDYEWLLTPPDTPAIPSFEKEAQKTVASRTANSNALPTTQQSKPTKPASGTNKSSSRPTSSNVVNASNVCIRRPSPSRGSTSTTSRSTTPAGRPTLPSTSKSSSTSTTSRSTTPAGRPTLPSTSKSSRSSTPTSRATLASSASSTKPTAPPKQSSTPTISSARSSTPTARPSTVTKSKSTSRSSTPTHRPSAPSNVSTKSALAGRSSSVTKSRATESKNPAPSRGISPSVKSRPSKNPVETSVLERPASASRGRPTLPILKMSTTDTNSTGRQGRNSCSPSRGKLSNTSANNSGKSCTGRTSRYSDNNDDVNPVLMGTKMVERVVNMRKLVPPKQDDHLSNPNSASGKLSSSQDSSGFGRSLSKKSFDMALRHMDIRRSMPGNLRAMITKVPASSMYSVRTDSTKSRSVTVSASDSPLATSSNASSDQLSESNN